MRKSFAVIVVFLFTNLFNAKSQTQTFNLQGYLIGASMPDSAAISESMMGEIEKIGSLYYLYFTYQPANKPGRIMYATSSDLNTWAIKDTVIYGVNDTLSREFIIGGPRVIKTSIGQYRMFYRACQKYPMGQDPKYHIRSAISNDGKNFTLEGVRIEINYYNPSSYFTHVGHSEFYYDQGGNLRALLTAEDTTMSTSNPDKLYTATSTDDGLTWSSFIPKYNQCHDPVVIKDSTGQYHAYFSYLNSGLRTITSPNGASWPATPDTLIMMQGTDTLTESSSPKKIADLGATVNTSGETLLISNYQSALGPWTHIAYYKNAVTTSILGYTFKSDFSVFPNPTDDLITVKLNNNTIGATYLITDQAGREVMTGKLNIETTIIDISQLSTGIYLFQAEQQSKQTFKVVKK